MEQEEWKWVEEIFPGIYRIGHKASAEAGNQAILIDKDGHTYLIFTDGYDYGSWVGKCYELTPQEREQVINWKEGSYNLGEWLSKKKEKTHV